MSDRVLAGLVDWIAQLARAIAVPVIGINGSQGSGKTTLARRLCAELARQEQLRAVILSLDDLYLPRAQREYLAAQVHPLLRTRGVPGTHDAALGLRLLVELRALDRSGGSVRIPKFVKSLDDRAPETAWIEVTAPVHAILFEGWCVGTPPQQENELQHPANALESAEDADARWRRYANESLAGDYARWFGELDRLVFLRIPDFDSVFRWRTQQERENVAEARALPGAANADPMTAAQLQRFIQHYERLTRHALAVLPKLADVTVDLGPEHEWLAVHQH